MAIYNIVSATHAKRVHSKLQPKYPPLHRDDFVMARMQRAWEKKQEAWEQAERKIPIHPDCFTIKEGDEASLFSVPVVIRQANESSFVYESSVSMGIAPKHAFTKYPIGSTWHGEEKEGYLIIGEQVL